MTACFKVRESANIHVILSHMEAICLYIQGPYKTLLLYAVIPMKEWILILKLTFFYYKMSEIMQIKLDSQHNS